MSHDCRTAGLSWRAMLQQPASKRQTIKSNENSGNHRGMLTVNRHNLHMKPAHLPIFRQVVLDNTLLPLNKLTKLLDGDKYEEKTAKIDMEAFHSDGCDLALQDCRPDHTDQELVCFVSGHGCPSQPVNFGF